MKNYNYFGASLLILLILMILTSCEKKVTCTLCGGDGKVGVFENQCRACYGSGKITKSKAEEKWDGTRFK
jgi:RecJ-like exonuclease